MLKTKKRSCSGSCSSAEASCSISPPFLDKRAVRANLAQIRSTKRDISISQLEFEQTSKLLSASWKKTTNDLCDTRKSTSNVILASERAVFDSMSESAEIISNCQTQTVANRNSRDYSFQVLNYLQSERNKQCKQSMQELNDAIAEMESLRAFSLSDVAHFLQAYR